MDINEFEKKYKTGMSSAAKEGKAVIKRLDEISEKVKETLRKEVERLVTDVTTLDEYGKMRAANPDDFFDKVKPELLCDIIARYSVIERGEHGIVGFDKDLEDAYEIKSSKKTSQKARANEVIATYKKVLEDNQKEIDKLKAELEKKEAAYTKLEEDVAAAYKVAVRDESPDSVALRKKFIEEAPAKLAAMKIEIDDLKTKIEGFEKIQAKYEAKIKDAITKFEDEFKEKCNVDVGSYSKDKTDLQTADNTATTSFSTNRINAMINTQDTDKQIARKMLDDIRNMDQKDMVNLINQYGYEDLLVMAQNLGPFGRTELRTILKSAIEADGVKRIKIGSDRFNLEDLMHGKMKADEINKIVKHIEEFTDNIDEMSYEDIQKFQEIVKAINLSALYDAANRKMITRFLNRFTAGGNAIRVLNQKLKKFSNARYERETLAIKTSNNLRSRIGLKEVPDQRPRMFVNRQKTKSIRDNRELR